MTTPLLEERKRLLADRLVAIRKLAERLAWSNKRVRFPLNGPSLRTMDEARAESLSAFIERFSKLQDLLGATFREVASLSGQPADDYNLVLSTMEKAGITNADEWRELRALRNEVAHEYSLDVERQAGLFNSLGEASGEILSTAERLARYSGERLGIEHGAKG